MDHEEDLALDKRRLAAIKNVYKELQAAIPTSLLPECFQDFTKISGKVCHHLNKAIRNNYLLKLQLLINGFTYTDGHDRRLGSAVFLSASSLNHSCAPNAVFSFLSSGHRRGIVVRALQRIQLEESQTMDEVATVSYIGNRVHRGD